MLGGSRSPYKLSGWYLFGCLRWERYLTHGPAILDRLRTCNYKGGPGNVSGRIARHAESLGTSECLNYLYGVHTTRKVLQHLGE